MVVMQPTGVDPIKAAINGAWAFCDEQQSALDRGLITEEEWFAIHERYFADVYLASENPRGQSGHGGDDARYRYTHQMILDAVDGDGSFLDVGCANGYLIEKLTEWARERGIALACYGLDISERLIALARRRLPDWADRFFVGNALHGKPQLGFRYVCVKELDYVPRARRKELFFHLLQGYVVKGGRLILGPWTERIDDPGIAAETTRWGRAPSGGCAKPHQEHRQLERRLYWYDVS
jgi:SAM-dependent methyltransferase